MAEGLTKAMWAPPKVISKHTACMCTHGCPICYPMGLRIGGSISKSLGPLRAHSANSFFWKKEHPSRTLLGGNEGLSRLFTGFHGVPRAFMESHGLSRVSTAFISKKESL